MNEHLGARPNRHLLLSATQLVYTPFFGSTGNVIAFHAYDRVSKPKKWDPQRIRKFIVFSSQQPSASLYRSETHVSAAV